MLTYFVIGCFFNTLLNFIYGVIVFIKGWRKKVNILCACMAFSFGVWTLGLGLMVCAKNIVIATFYLKYVHYFGTIFISPFLLHFVLAFLNKEKENLFLLVVNYILVVILLIANFTDRLASVSIKPPFHFYTDSQGFFYILFMGVLAGDVIYSHYLMYQEYKQSSGHRREQMKYLLIGLAVTFITGATSFFYVFNIKIFPFGVPLAFTYVLTATYAIVKHRLMDITLLARDTAVFLIYLGVIIVLFLPLIVLPVVIAGAEYIWISAITAIIMAILAPWLHRLFTQIEKRSLGQKAIAWIDQKIFKKKFSYLRQQQTFWEDLLRSPYTSEEIACELVAGEMELIGLESASFMMYNAGQKGFVARVQIGLDDVIGDWDTPLEVLERGNPLLKALTVYKKIIVREELNSMMPLEEAQAVDKVMKTIRAQVSVPLFEADTLIGILNLSAKLSGAIYHDQDIEKLQTLAHVSQTHLAHILFMEKRAMYSRNVAHDMRNMSQRAALTIERFLKKYSQEVTNNEALQELESHRQQLVLLYDIQEKMFNMANIMARVLSGEYERYQFPLKAIADTVEHSLKPNAEMEGLYLRFEIPDDLPNIYGNHQDIQDALINVITNGLKFTEKGGLTVRAKEDNGKVIIEIEDTGCGIPREKQDDIFMPLFKEGKRAGSGLGLTIVKEIMEANKGHVWVRSTVGKGTTFYLSLPTSEKEPTAEVQRKERRRHVRLDYSMQVDYTIKDDPNTYSGKCVNISLSGIRVALDQQLPIGDSIRLKLITIIYGIIEIEARVVWCHESGGKPKQGEKQCYHCGLEFVNLAKKSKRSFADFMGYVTKKVLHKE